MQTDVVSNKLPLRRLLEETAKSVLHLMLFSIFTNNFYKHLIEFTPLLLLFINLIAANTLRAFLIHILSIVVFSIKFSSAGAVQFTSSSFI